MATVDAKGSNTQVFIPVYKNPDSILTFVVHIDNLYFTTNGSITTERE